MSPAWKAPTPKDILTIRVTQEELKQLAVERKLAWKDLERSGTSFKNGSRMLQCLTGRKHRGALTVQLLVSDAPNLYRRNITLDAALCRSPRSVELRRLTDAQIDEWLLKNGLGKRKSRS